LSRERITSRWKAPSKEGLKKLPVQEECQVRLQVHVEERHEINLIFVLEMILQ
jgi:hypothetical protein